jgi:hypothetical protein
MIDESETTCPRCGELKLKHWADLTDEEKALAVKLPASAEYSPEERKKHRICTRCWFEIHDGGRTRIA